MECPRGRFGIQMSEVTVMILLLLQKSTEILSNALTGIVMNE